MAKFRLLMRVVIAALCSTTTHTISSNNTAPASSAALHAAGWVYVRRHEQSHLAAAAAGASAACIWQGCIQQHAVHGARQLTVGIIDELAAIHELILELPAVQHIAQHTVDL